MICDGLNFRKPTTTTTTTSTKAAPVTTTAPVKTCKSVGDPHVYPFVKAQFDTHLAGWTTLYKKGNLVIAAEQKVWSTSNQGVAINRAVRYSTDGGATYTTLQNGQSDQVNFPTVKLVARARDFRTRRNIHADCKFIYDIFITTSDYAGATGQCVEGKLQGDTSDQVAFPSGANVRVTVPQAQAACAVISDPALRADCVTDVRMINDPAVTKTVVDGFLDVEAVDKALANGQPVPHPATAGGFQLAMRFSSQSAFTFNSAYWTSCSLLDASDASPSKDADGKFATFNNIVATEIRGCLPNGCGTYTLPQPMTLHELFTSTPVSSSQNIQFASQTSTQWATISGASGLTSGWTGTGINYDDDRSQFKARVRFGALFNNEATVVTVNDAVGFGATEASGQSVGAGWTRYSPSHKVGTQGTIWVKGTPTTKPCAVTTTSALVTTRPTTTTVAKVPKTCYSVGDPRP